MACVCVCSVCLYVCSCKLVCINRVSASPPLQDVTQVDTWILFALSTFLPSVSKRRRTCYHINCFIPPPQLSKVNSIDQAYFWESIRKSICFRATNWMSCPFSFYIRRPIGLTKYCNKLPVLAGISQTDSLTHSKRQNSLFVVFVKTCKQSVVNVKIAVQKQKF